MTDVTCAPRFSVSLRADKKLTLERVFGFILHGTATMSADRLVNSSRLPDGLSTVPRTAPHQRVS